MSLRFHLFGRMRCVRNGSPVPALEGRKTAEFLAYLLLARGKTLHRERVASDLWGAASTRGSLKRLRQALWRLQAAMTETATFLQVDADWLQLDGRGLWIDVAEFEAAWAATGDRSGFDLTPESGARLRAAARLYTGDLLAGWDLEWCAIERERLRGTYLSLLDKLMDHEAQVGQPESGLAYGASALALDGAREATHRRVMQLHYLAGNRTEALRQYDRCARALGDELGVQPGRRTDALREAIRADRGVVALVVDGGRRERVQQVSDDLQHLRHLVSVLQRQLATKSDDVKTRA